jgi:hypothetical protein
LAAPRETTGTAKERAGRDPAGYVADDRVEAIGEPVGEQNRAHRVVVVREAGKPEDDHGHRPFVVLNELVERRVELVYGRLQNGSDVLELGLLPVVAQPRQVGKDRGHPAKLSEKLVVPGADQRSDIGRYG